jgi:hypothetical protein
VDSLALSAVAKNRWNSAAYDHFITLKYRVKGDGSADYLEFVLRCRADPVDYKLYHCRRMHATQGTKNLNRFRGIKECIEPI